MNPLHVSSEANQIIVDLQGRIEEDMMIVLSLRKLIIDNHPISHRYASKLSPEYEAVITNCNNLIAALSDADKFMSQIWKNTE